MTRGVIEQAIVRANPRYELVLLDRLAGGERELLVAELGDEHGLYGVLRARDGAPLELRAASADTALLFLTLAEPGRLPSYAAVRLGADLERSIARLVLDGVLEVEHDGGFVSGAQAGELLLSGRSDGGRGRIGELSASALRYGQELVGLPEALLGLRLYFYGRRPVPPALERRLPDESAVADYLGIATPGPARTALDAGWVAVAAKPGRRRYWRQWRPRGHGGGHGADTHYKLYVSPSVDALPAAFAAVAETMATARGVTAFKVGADVHGICRPDKLVVYFDRLDDLRNGAAVLRARLAGCPAHGVPFTAAVTSDGLLSWGADPPVLPGGAATSWRMWVTGRLAEYLVVARGAAAGELAPWQFALERLRLSGIDTDTWVPASGMWPEALAGV
jgi:hypothetical protein